MHHLLLSGGAYGADWLPLMIFPLLCVLLLLYAGDFATKYYRKWRLYRENKLINDINTTIPESGDSAPDNNSES